METVLLSQAAASIVRSALNARCDQPNGRVTRFRTISTDGYVGITTLSDAGPNRTLREEQWTRSFVGTHRLEFECIDEADGNTHLRLTVDDVRAMETSDKQQVAPGYVGMYA